MKSLKPVFFTVGIVVFAAIALLMLSSSTNEPNPSAKIPAAAPPVAAPQMGVAQNVVSVPIPDVLTFAGESVPLGDIEVKERIDKELLVNTYWHSSTIQLIKRANRFFPTIERILAQEGVPDDFKYLALAESGLENATSSAGAKGYWQFLKSTATSYGLEVNGEVDERYHLEKSTRAACKYLKKERDKFGSWTMAAAAYNMGSNGLNNQKQRQKQSNYYQLLLNNETKRYVPRILALKMIVSSPSTYGFNVPMSERYPPLQYREVTVSSSVANFADFAIQNGTTYKMLKFLNPWLRDNNLTVVKNTYLVKLPN